MKRIKESESGKQIAILAPDPEYGDYFDIEWKLCDSEEDAQEWLNSKIEGTFNFDEQCMYDLYESEEGGEYCDIIDCDSGDKFFAVEDDGDKIVYETYTAKALKNWLDHWGAEYGDDDDWGECWIGTDWECHLKIWNINTHEEVTGFEQLNESNKKMKESEDEKYIGILVPNPEKSNCFDIEWKLCDNKEDAKEWLNSKIDDTFYFDEKGEYDLYESEDGSKYCDLLKYDGGKFFGVLTDCNHVVHETYKDVENLKGWLDYWRLRYKYDKVYDECWTGESKLGTRVYLKVWDVNTKDEIVGEWQLKESKRKSRRSSLRENSRNDKVLFEASQNAFDAYSEPFFDHVNRDWFEGLPFDVIFNKKDRENNWKGLLQGKIKDIIFIADEAGIDPQEDLVFYDEDGNVIHDVYTLLYDTDEVFTESKRKSRRSSLRENYQDFDYAYYKTKRIANSLCKEFDKDTVKVALCRVSDEL